ncbi:hypothetical protein C8F04DRAFT_1234365 [Mycena alexandri]|uniref:Uncharacterized protein n=1 Tax=Mycena alexandri TaxID=1745969 RepID=A0AAD6SUZ9_9AGAR|nr:hypothetical protein C8F04DRAFT_1234365 [Mycena alexandri]
MLLSIFGYALLIVLLAMSNWDRVLLFLSWIYSLASRWLTTPTILVVYGLMLIYLLLVVHGLATAHEKRQKRHKNVLVPYYDGNGQLQGWVREEPEMTKSNGPPPEWLSPPAARTRAITAPRSSVSVQTAATLPNFPLESWDGFPDHRFQCHFTRQQVEDTSRLAFYWIADKLPGKRGSTDAITPEKGKLSRFKCAGIIQCKTVVCTVQIAPGSNVARQIEALCTCGSTLRHRSCKVEWSVVFYRDGAVFENSGPHNHPKYTHSLPVLKKKKMELQDFISRQPIPLQSSSHSYTGEDGDDTQGNFDLLHSDQEASAGQDSEDQGNVDVFGAGMNSEDEQNLDSMADEDEDQEDEQDHNEEEDDKEEAADDVAQKPGTQA